MTTPPRKIVPLDLQRTAKAIAATRSDHGTVIISHGADGLNVGVHGMSAKDLRAALCYAISYSYTMKPNQP